MWAHQRPYASQSAWLTSISVILEHNTAEIELHVIDGIKVTFVNAPSVKPLEIVQVSKITATVQRGCFRTILLIFWSPTCTDRVKHSIWRYIWASISIELFLTWSVRLEYWPRNARLPRLHSLRGRLYALVWKLLVYHYFSEELFAKSASAVIRSRESAVGIDLHNSPV